MQNLNHEFRIDLGCKSQGANAERKDTEPNH